MDPAGAVGAVTGVRSYIDLHEDGSLVAGRGDDGEPDPDDWDDEADDLGYVTLPVLLGVLFVPGVVIHLPDLASTVLDATDVLHFIARMVRSAADLLVQWDR